MTFFSTIFAILTSFAAAYTFFAFYLFTINLNWFLPATVDAANNTPANRDFKLDVAINIGLFFLFGLMHSLTARKSFKSLFGLHHERAAFLLVTVIFMNIFLLNWRPLVYPTTQTKTETYHWVLFGICQAIGMFLFVMTNIVFKEDDVFGLYRCYQLLTIGKVTERKEACSSGFPYNIVRHPMYLGILFMLGGELIIPQFRTVSRLCFLGVAILYLRIGMGYEERDLVRKFGKDYEEYSKRVDSLIPFSFFTRMFSGDRKKIE